MAEKIRKYEYKKVAIAFWLLASVFFFITAFIWLTEDMVLDKIFVILLFINAVFLLAISIHALKYTVLATTDSEIIFGKIPFAKPLHIPVKDIAKIKIQKDKLIWPGVLIWYNCRDEIRKERIIMKSFKQKDRIEFYKYLENLVESNEPGNYKR